MITRRPLRWLWGAHEITWGFIQVITLSLSDWLGWLPLKRLEGAQSMPMWVITGPTLKSLQVVKRLWGLPISLIKGPRGQLDVYNHAKSRLMFLEMLQLCKCARRTTKFWSRPHSWRVAILAQCPKRRYIMCATKQSDVQPLHNSILRVAPVQRETSPLNVKRPPQRETSPLNVKGPPSKWNVPSQREKLLTYNLLIRSWTYL